VTLGLGTSDLRNANLGDARILVLEREGELRACLERVAPPQSMILARESCNEGRDKGRDEDECPWTDPTLDVVLAELPETADERGRLLAAVAETTTADWILVSSAADAASIEAVHEAGAKACLSRPLIDAALRSALSSVLERRRMREENSRLRATVDTVERCGDLTRCLEPGKLYPMALDILLDVTGRRRGLALFRREAMPKSDSAALRGFSEDESRELCRALIDDKRVDIDEYEGIALIDRGTLLDGLASAGLEVGRLMVVPLRGHDDEAGLLCLFETEHPFESHEIDSAVLVARHTEGALVNAETYALAKERAFIDDVTEVYNARYLLSTLDNEIQRAERYGNPLSLLFLDLDRFKLVNDQHGHLVGSETLRRLSRLLGDGVRQVDTLARYGGDEFTILLVDTGHEEAMVIAERIRREVEEAVFEVSGAARLQLTISIGVATCPEHGMTREPLLDAADKAMYRAKSEGRNRICSARELG